jgi:hypothetical protein
MKKIRWQMCITISSILLLGCMTIPKENIIPVEKYYIIPEIGIVNVVYIGDSLIKEGKTSASDAIYLSSNHGTRGWTAYHPAGIYKQIGKDDLYIIYQGLTLEGNGWTYVYPQILEDKTGNVYLKGNSENVKLQQNEYTKKKYVEETGNDFEQRLIYTGAEGTILKFSYREFSNDIARPAFTIDATYDIKYDNIIRFKGASLEIIKVDNQTITYKLLSGFKSNQ